MLPSSTTPNFSRPFPSPLSTSALDSPKRQALSRSAHDLLPKSASLFSLSPQTYPKDKSPPKKPFDRCSVNFESPKRFSRGGSSTTAVKDNGGSVTSNASPKPYGKRLSRVRIKCSDNSIAGSIQTNLSISSDLGVAARPILNFRAHVFKHLDPDRRELNVDLFWPIKLDARDDGGDDEMETDGEEDSEDEQDNEDKSVFPYSDLRPLMAFRSLRYLQINGMTRSYQPLIWATVWLNSSLTDLHLEMALPPTINPNATETSWLRHRLVDHTWSYTPQPSHPDFEYLGDHGTGVLHEGFGIGEYLDQQAIKMSQLEIATQIPVENLRFLPVARLTLMNFVVDAGPFFRWFDPKKLVELNLLFGCVDAGFALPAAMQESVRVTTPGPPRAPMPFVSVPASAVRVVSMKDRNAKAVQSNAACGSNGGLKTKLSQIMPKLGKSKKSGLRGLEVKEDKL